MKPRSIIAVHYVLVALIALVLGYVAGRAHVKYEMRPSPGSEAVQSQSEPVANGGGLNYQLVETVPPKSDDPQAKLPPPSASGPAAFKVALIRKGFHEHDLQKNELQDVITFSLSFENIEGKDVRAFEGVVTFCDLLDNHILSCSVAVTRPVAAGNSIEWNGQLNYIQFLDSHKKLKNESKANLRVIFTPIKIIFADGSTRQFEYSR
ncbi:MAG: hypothetical protein ABFD69_14925 [Candidatus Sumerlaeia bacterium]